MGIKIPKACRIYPDRFANLDLEVEKKPFEGALRSAPLLFGGEGGVMKKIKERTGKKLARGTTSARKGSRKPVDLVEIRQQIANLVGNDAVGMVEVTMEEVEKGHYLGMKYLFEMIGLYPAAGEDGVVVPDTMGAILLRRLGLPEPATEEPAVTKDQATAAAVSDEEGLE
jgi:hypothetical protein